MNPLWDLLLCAAREHGPRAAIAASHPGHCTWGALPERIEGLAGRLTRAGLRETDRVALLADNGSEALQAAFAAVRCGAVLVPLDPRLALREHEQILERAGCRLVMTDSRHAARAAELEGQVVLLRPEGSGEGQAHCPPLRAVQPSNPAQLYFTSGTTGRPKGVILTHGNLHAHALAAVEALELTEDDTWGHFAPMFHLADAWATFAITAVGGTHAFLSRFGAQECLETCVRDGVTLTNLVPTMLQRVLAAIEDGAPAPPDLRLCLSGGAPIAPAVVERVLLALGCSYRQTYGLTETSPYLTLSGLNAEEAELPLPAQAQRLARTGSPFPTVELRVVDPSGELVPGDDATVGEIIVRGPTVSPGYWQDEQATAAAHRDGWFHTGDLATLDASGSVRIVDRLKDMILSGGETVYSIEVEAALLAHPAVLECAVFALPHQDLGETVAAAVVLRAGREATREELVQHCRARIAGFKVPRRLWLLEALPRTGSGKILKRDLREQAHRGQLDPGGRGEGPGTPG